jgi:hypothetical protein
MYFSLDTTSRETQNATNITLADAQNTLNAKGFIRKLNKISQKNSNSNTFGLKTALHECILATHNSLLGWGENFDDSIGCSGIK